MNPIRFPLISRLFSPLLLLVAAALRAAEPAVIQLWPEGVPGLHADASEEKIVNGRFVNIHYPSLTVYAPIFRPGNRILTGVGCSIDSTTSSDPTAEWARRAISSRSTPTAIARGANRT